MNKDVFDEAVTLTKREADDIFEILTSRGGESLIKFLFDWTQKNRAQLEKSGLPERKSDELRGLNGGLKKLMSFPERHRNRQRGAAVDSAA